MQKFSLSGKNIILPENYLFEGKVFPIYTDYRRILRILRMLSDSEVCSADKHSLMARMFFKEKIPPDPQNAFQWFVDCGEAREGSGDKDFDFEQDAREIYAAFMQVYGIDLLDTEMHWWRFSILLDGVFASSNALSNKVQLRHIDDSKAKRKNDLHRAKRNAAITQPISRGDASLEQRIRDRLMEGKPIDDLIGGEKHGRRQTDV